MVQGRCLVTQHFKWIPPGRSGSGKISSRYFAIGAKNKNLAGQSVIGVLRVGFSQIRALKKTCPTCLKYEENQGSRESRQSVERWRKHNGMYTSRI